LRSIGLLEAAAADYGSPRNLLISGFTVATILAVTRYGNRFMANCAILAGMVFGYLLAIPLSCQRQRDRRRRPFN
jgi:xanthine/uracil permease